MPNNHGKPTTEQLEQAFAKVLRDLREDKGWSQEQLAFESGLDRTFISLLERGGRRPSLATLAVLANALGLTLTDFVSRIETQARQSIK